MIEMSTINKRKPSGIKIRGTNYKTRFRAVKEEDAAKKSDERSIFQHMFDYADGITKVYATTDDGQEYTFEVPTKRSGEIPSEVALMRLIHTSYDDDRKKPSSPWIDVKETSEQVIPHFFPNKEQKILQYLWWQNPDSMDINHIDTKDPIWLDAEKEEGQKRAAVAIIGTKEEREAVRKIIETNFTNKERAYMNGAVIDVKYREPKPGVAGFYHSDGNGKGNDYIAIWRKSLFKNPDVRGAERGQYHTRQHTHT